MKNNDLEQCILLHQGNVRRTEDEIILKCNKWMHCECANARLKRLTVDFLFFCPNHSNERIQYRAEIQEIQNETGIVVRKISRCMNVVLQRHSQYEAQSNFC